MAPIFEERRREAKLRKEEKERLVREEAERRELEEAQMVGGNS